MKKIILFILFFLMGLSSIQANTNEKVQDGLMSLYIATFNRAPDAKGFNYWLNESGLTLEEIAQSFFDQPETQKRRKEEGVRA